MQGPGPSSYMPSPCPSPMAVSFGLMASGPAHMLTSQRLLPPSWASSQKTFQTCVPTSVLSVSTWVLEGLSASVRPGQTPTLPLDLASPEALPISATTASPPPRVAQARNLGLSLHLPFLPHLTSDSSANPVGSIFKIFPESSHLSPLWLPPPQSRPVLSQQLLNGLRGLPIPLPCYSLSPPLQLRGQGVLLNPRQRPS